MVRLDWESSAMCVYQYRVVQFSLYEELAIFDTHNTKARQNYLALRHFW